MMFGLKGRMKLELELELEVGGADQIESKFEQRTKRGEPRRVRKSSTFGLGEWSETAFASIYRVSSTSSVQYPRCRHQQAPISQLPRGMAIYATGSGSAFMCRVFGGRRNEELRKGSWGIKVKKRNKKRECATRIQREGIMGNTGTRYLFDLRLMAGLQVPATPAKTSSC